MMQSVLVDVLSHFSFVFYAIVMIDVMKLHLTRYLIIGGLRDFLRRI
jgi:hypothetical protein